MKTLTRLLEFLAKEELTRQDALVSLGGGVAGDISGFAASCYLRGIPYIQIPTTLLAAVDSSVGGKTGVNLSLGKNLAGAFWQPSLVLCDCLAFETLPPHRLKDGLAEAVKCGVIRDRALFDFLLDKDLSYFIDSPPPDAFPRLVESCVRLKRDLVEADERDLGLRQLLNFGHTVGHAIEKCSDYKITHGHAVAFGMLIVSKAAFLMHMSGDVDCSVEIKRILQQYQFPLVCPYTATELFLAALMDKKRTNEQITLVVPVTVGDCQLKRIDVALLKKFIEEGLENGR